jgi:hypothetical protein
MDKKQEELFNQYLEAFKKLPAIFNVLIELLFEKKIITLEEMQNKSIELYGLSEDEVKRNVEILEEN